VLALLIRGVNEGPARWRPAFAPVAQTDDDHTLVQQIVAGDRMALAHLYDRYAALLLSVARRILGDGRDPEDLVHDVFLEVWKRASGYESSRASVRTWLLVRLRSRALDRVKSAHATRMIPRPLERFVNVPDEEREAAPDTRALASAIGMLTEDQRCVVELAYFEGLSGAEIALRVSIPIGTVKSRLSAAITRLRSELGVTLRNEDAETPQ